MGKSVTLKETRAVYAVTLDEVLLRQAPFTIERRILSPKKQGAHDE